jgi:NADH:ubiquinone oxidoreductase subunit 3 (subunit A)
MTDELWLTPPVAFLVYLGLAGLLFLIGRQMAGKNSTTPWQSTTYASGEQAADDDALPGYAGMFVIALFFAVLHVGVLMVGSSDLSGLVVIYLIGLALALVALVIG